MKNKLIILINIIFLSFIISNFSMASNGYDDQEAIRHAAEQLDQFDKQKKRDAWVERIRKEDASSSSGSFSRFGFDLLLFIVLVGGLFFYIRTASNQKKTLECKKVTENEENVTEEQNEEEQNEGETERRQRLNIFIELYESKTDLEKRLAAIKKIALSEEDKAKVRSIEAVFSDMIEKIDKLITN